MACHIRHYGATLIDFIHVFVIFSIKIPLLLIDANIELGDFNIYENLKVLDGNSFFLDRNPSVLHGNKSEFP